MKFEGIGTLNGKSVSVDLEAPSKEVAIKMMSDRGYREVSVVEKASFFQKATVKMGEMSIVFRQLASFSLAGETFAKSLADVADVTKNKVLKDALLDIRRRIEIGTSIPVAFGQHKIFPPIVVNLLKVADKTGEMDTILDEIAKYLEQLSDIEDGVSSSMLYPKIIMGIMLIVGTGLVTYILPQFRQFYTDMHIEMPGVTKFLYAVSDFINEDWMIAVPGFLALIYFLKNTKQYVPNLHEKLELSLPIIGPIMRNLYMFRFCKTMQILSQSGVEILDSLQLVRNAMGNHFYTDILDKTIPLVRIGESLSSSMRRNDPEGHFDVLAMAFLSSGEETNNIGDLMKSASDYYQKQLRLGIDNFGKQLEPIMLVFISIFVFILVLSIYLPIFRMSQLTGG